MRFLINRDKLKELAAFRGWSAIYTRLAEATGFSVSYCRRVVLGREKLTEFFMLQYIKAAGCSPKRPSEWGALFDVVLNGSLPPDHSPSWNLYKMKGLGVPYKLFSPAYEFRKRDNPNVEIESLSSVISTRS